MPSFMLHAEQISRDTLPINYYECIDTAQIEGDKDVFFKSFEHDILKASLEEIQSFNKEEFHLFFTELYSHAFFTKQLYDAAEDRYVLYRENPICELLQVYLRTRIEVEKEKALYQALADTLNLNTNIKDLKYRIWISPTFCKQKVLEIYIHPTDTRKNKVIEYTFENYGWTDVKMFDMKIERTIILRISDSEWKNFTTKTASYNLPSLLQQMDEIRFRYTVRDGMGVIVEIYDNAELIHLLDYYSPIRNVGRSEHSKTFKEFFELVEQTFVFNTCER